MAHCTPQDDGPILFFFHGWGSLGSATSPMWEYVEFSAAQGGPQAAVTWLNEALRRGAGQVTGAARPDGSAALWVLTPGNPGTDLPQEWAYQEFTAADGGTQVALNTLNRGGQGPGEISALARIDGTVSMFYLTPASLKASTRRWTHREITAADGGIQAARRFLGPGDQRRGRPPGEASVMACGDDSVSLFYLETDNRPI